MSAVAWSRLIPPALIVAALSVLTFGFLLPIIWMVSTSFQAAEKVFALPLEWVPAVLHPENYPNALSRAPIPRYFWNSAIAAVAVTISNLALCTMAGYGLAKFRFPGHRLLLLLILCTLMLPIEVVLVPTFLVVKQFGWLNSFQGLVAPLLVDAFGVFLMRQFILGIPQDYIEAARIDGAGEFTIFSRVVVPQCLPALTALAIFAFRDNWDLYIWPLVVISKDELRTLPLGFVRFTEDFTNSQAEQMAIAVLTMLPVALLFLLMQRGFMRGIALSGLK